MLRELSVQNLALIEDVRVELSSGFCAWTGETGAGKSLLLGALGLLLGDRGNSDLIRTGAAELRVVGVFELNRDELRTAVEAILDEKLGEQTVVLMRRLSAAGGSKAYANETPISVQTLKRLGEVLVDIHGQRETHSLLEPAYQLEMLDKFGDLEEQRRKYQTKANELRELRKRWKQLNADQETRQRELSLLRFEREELQAAELQPDERPELERERQRLTHARSLQEFTALCAELLDNAEGSIGEQLGRLAKKSHQWVEIDSQLADISNRLDDLAAEARDLASTCDDLSQTFESDPARQDEVEKRLQLLKRLEHKYRRPLDELIAYAETLDAKERELQQEENDLSGIIEEISVKYTEVKSAATALSKSRTKVAKKLASETQVVLAELGMPAAKLETQLEKHSFDHDPLTAEIPVDGFDEMELMLTANPGEPSRPLRKVASGGELSRTMLALKSVLAAHDPVGTLIFDEIDSNVGGRLGDVLGRKLSDLGRTHQVICVTHLPQVASFAANQWTIRKSTKGKRTSTIIAPLTTTEERLEEVASMLRGESAGATTRQEAAVMLEEAKKFRCRE